MAKRYNIKIVEMDTQNVVYEEELKFTETNGEVYLDVLINTLFVSIERAIENDS